MKSRINAFVFVEGDIIFRSGSSFAHSKRETEFGYRLAKAGRGIRPELR